jgi:hypothetical protein
VPEHERAPAAVAAMTDEQQDDKGLRLSRAEWERRALYLALLARIRDRQASDDR